MFFGPILIIAAAPMHKYDDYYKQMCPILVHGFVPMRNVP